MHRRFSRLFTLSFAVSVLLLSAQAELNAADWPMWRCDAGHTASSPDELPPQLHRQWVRHYAPRVPVWDDPLNRDMMSFDRIFEPVVSGGRMFVGFNDSDKIVALDVEDGTELWTFYTDGPVRFSPVIVGKRVYVASDDGCLYCLAAANGELRWQFRGGPSERKLLGNRRVISTWPARGGPVATDGTIYFAAGIWPFMGTFIYALDAETGQVLWGNDDTSADFQKQPHRAPSFAGIAPQGQLAVADDLLLVPGGRSLPAAFDRNTGEFKFFNFGGKGEGGSFVAASASHAYVHTRVRGTMAINLPDGTATKIRVNEPVLADGRIYTAVAAVPTDDATSDEQAVPAEIVALDKSHEQLWKIEADATGDLIQAGGRLYAAGADSITAIQLPRDDAKAEIAWSLPVDGKVVRLLAASDRLFAVTLDGRILAFGEQQIAPPAPFEELNLPKPGQIAVDAARAMLESTGQREGYALWFGIDDAELLEAVLLQSDLHVVAVDPDAAKVATLREHFDTAGLYGRRIAIHVGTPESYQAPPYIANLVVVGASAGKAASVVRQLDVIYQSVRPYGGKLVLQTEKESTGALRAAVTKAKLEQASVESSRVAVIVTREGALPGAADWTHAYGDVANTVKSNDRRVKLPLGILWFGGPSNMDVLPRHGHGPSQQIIGGRLFIEGMNNINAWDVYTGRVLWKREFEDLGTFHMYYDETYKNTPLSTAYNLVHLPGANTRGTNYVATADGVYLVLRDRCLLLDAATGETLREFVLPTDATGRSPEWGYVGVYENLLLAGVGFGDYSERLDYEFTSSGKKGLAWSPDHGGSLALAAFDRQSGRIAWQVGANHSFMHNGIVAGGGRIYLLDKLPKRVEEQNQRRGIDDDGDSFCLLVIDAASGKELWTSEETFGTWLSYSAEHDLLLQAGAAASDRSPDEVGSGMVVFKAADGELVWKKPNFSYAGPCMLHGDSIITNTTSYKESRGAFSLLDGEPVMIDDPVTGQPIPWRFLRTYGCNTAVAAENLLTFRSGAAGFYDLANHGGTGNFGGFKSGCSSNLIVADGVLTAPDYTRTCTCGYQNQTSLAMIPMLENEIWTHNLFAQPEGAKPEIRRLGVNFGAPGDRRAEDGTLWINHPADEGSSPKVEIETEGQISWHIDHSSRITAGDLPWVAASAATGIERLTIRLNAPSAVTYTVRLVFAERDANVESGQRVFDVLVQDKSVATDYDVVAAAGGPNRSTVLACANVQAKDALVVELGKKSDLPPVLCGVEISRQD